MAAKINIKELIAKIPRGVRIALAILPSVIFASLFVKMAIMPKRAQIETLKQEISQQDTEITKKKSMAARLDTLKVEQERLKQILSDLEVRLPAEKEISSLLKQVSELGKNSGLQILTWTPAARSMHPSGIVYQVPVSVTLRGSYHKMGMFFSSLTGLDRIVNITNIRMSGAQTKGSEAVLSVSFSAVTFTAVPQEAPAQ